MTFDYTTFRAQFSAGRRHRSNPEDANWWKRPRLWDMPGVSHSPVEAAALGALRRAAQRRTDDEPTGDHALDLWGVELLREVAAELRAEAALIRLEAHRAALKTAALEVIEG